VNAEEWTQLKALMLLEQSSWPEVAFQYLSELLRLPEKYKVCYFNIVANSNRFELEVLVASG